MATRMRGGVSGIGRVGSNGYGEVMRAITAVIRIEHHDANAENIGEACGDVWLRSTATYSDFGRHTARLSMARNVADELDDEGGDPVDELRSRAMLWLCSHDSPGVGEHAESAFMLE